MTTDTWAATGPAETGKHFRGSKPPPPFVAKPPAPPQEKAKARKRIKSVDNRLGPKADVDMDELKKLRRQGMSIRAIAKAMDICKGTVSNRLLSLETK